MSRETDDLADLTGKALSPEVEEDLEDLRVAVRHQQGSPARPSAALTAPMTLRLRWPPW